MGQLTSIFLDATRGREDLPDNDDEFERLLQQAVETARSPWPELRLPAEDFVRYLSQRLPEARPGIPLARVLEQMYLADLYVASACMRGETEAIKLLEQHHLAALKARLNLPAPMKEEVCQDIRVQLLTLMTPAGRQLASYKGHGSLLSWLLVIVNRSIRAKKTAPIRVSPEEQLRKVIEALPAQETDAEFALIRGRFQRDFRKALCDAITTLTKDQRRLLRFYYIDRLTTTQLGKLCGVDQSTASRRLEQARKAIFEETKRLLEERLQLASQEFDSLLLAIQSQLEASIIRFLSETDDEDT